MYRKKYIKVALRFIYYCNQNLYYCRSETLDLHKRQCVCSLPINYSWDSGFTEDNMQCFIDKLINCIRTPPRQFRIAAQNMLF